MPSVRIAHTVAQSPYVAPFPSAKKDQEQQERRKNIKEGEKVWRM